MLYCTSMPCLITKHSAVQKVQGPQKLCFDNLTPPCDRNIEGRDPCYDTLSCNDVQIDQAGCKRFTVQKIQEPLFRRYRNHKHIERIQTLAVTLTLKTKTQSFKWQSIWYTCRYTSIPSLVSKVIQFRWYSIRIHFFLRIRTSTLTLTKGLRYFHDTMPGDYISMHMQVTVGLKMFNNKDFFHHKMWHTHNATIIVIYIDISSYLYHVITMHLYRFTMRLKICSLWASSHAETPTEILLWIFYELLWVLNETFLHVSQVRLCHSIMC